MNAVRLRIFPLVIPESSAASQIEGISLANYIAAAFMMLAAIVSVYLPADAAASPAEVTIIEERLERLKLQLQREQEELKYVQYKRKATQDKLRSYQDELEKKEQLLEELKQTAENSPTFENEQAVKNEQRRIELAGITIKSRVASVVRLESKEQELQSAIGDLETSIEEDEERLRLARVEEKAEEKTDALKQKLEALRRENEGLRAQREAALAEARRQEEARRQAEEAERLAQEQREAELAEAERLAREEESLKREIEAQRALRENSTIQDDDVSEELGLQGESVTATNRVNTSSSDATDPASVSSSFPGESGPIENGAAIVEDQGRMITLEGPGIDQQYVFDYEGGHRYRAEAIVVDTLARVTVNGKTYKLRVKDADVGETYVFLYNIENPDKPSLSSYKKQQDEIEESSLASD